MEFFQRYASTERAYAGAIFQNAVPATKAEAIDFLSSLHGSPFEFHIDDSPETVISGRTGARLFTDAQAAHITACLDACKALLGSSEAVWNAYAPPAKEPASIDTRRTYVELAKEFCRVIREDLTPEQLTEVLKRNAAEPSDAICHTHDFIDANMSMLEAWQALNLPAQDGNDETQCACWNSAWALAKSSQFDAKKVAATWRDIEKNGL